MSATPLDRCVTSLDAISRELQAVYEFARGRRWIRTGGLSTNMVD